MFAFSLTDLATEWKTALQSQGWKSGYLQLTPQRIIFEWQSEKQSECLDSFSILAHYLQWVSFFHDLQIPYLRKSCCFSPDADWGRTSPSWWIECKILCYLIDILDFLKNYCLRS